MGIRWEDGKRSTDIIQEERGAFYRTETEGELFFHRSGDAGGTSTRERTLCVGFLKKKNLFRKSIILLHGK